jgi:hypothetical protein
MASRIQARIRGKLARRGVMHLVDARDKRKAIRNKAATKIQCMARMRRSYITYMLRLQAYRSSMRASNEAATKVQAIYRGRLARRLVRDRSGDNHEEMIYRSREYTEIWDEDSQGYFYYNNATEQALWEPPAGGFTKADGKLVLRNGDVIPDPEVDPAANSKKCIECTTEYASRYCTDCDDHYCDGCWGKSHSAGKRALHSFELTGPTKCVECSVDVAVMWCDDCDDPYCKDCFSSVHKAGKRKKHKWTTIGAEPVILEEEGAGGAVAESGGGVDGFMQAEESGGEWSEYFDDESGSPYWYNETTGESSYTNPYDAAAADAAMITTEGYGADAYGSESYGDPNGGEFLNSCLCYHKICLLSILHIILFHGSFFSFLRTGGGGGWTEQYDDDGNVYWWNESTGESSYQDPNGGGGGGEEEYGGYGEGEGESYGY